MGRQHALIDFNPFDHGWRNIAEVEGGAVGGDFYTIDKNPHSPAGHSIEVIIDLRPKSAILTNPDPHCTIQQFVGLHIAEGSLLRFDHISGKSTSFDFPFGRLPSDGNFFYVYFSIRLGILQGIRIRNILDSIVLLGVALCKEWCINWCEN